MYIPLHLSVSKALSNKAILLPKSADMTSRSDQTEIAITSLYSYSHSSYTICVWIVDYTKDIQL